MDARRSRAAWMAAVAVVLLAHPAFAGSYRTQNFLVTAPTAQLAKEIGDSAEVYREKLAIEWLGRPMQPWSEPCPISAQVAPHLGAGGATSFYFENNRPYGWTMSIQGSRERVLDSVLPHEVTHAIFATYFGRPLPRWADEGACTTVEHSSERNKQEKMLVEFLTSNRGISFNKMFAMKEYPPDVLPLYSQGFSLARFLIAQGGKPKFVQYVGEGMRSNNWPVTTAKHYGFEDLSDLQLSWVEWVRNGSQEVEAFAYSPLSPERHPSVVHLSRNRNAVASNVAVNGAANAVRPAAAMNAVASNSVAANAIASNNGANPGTSIAQTDLMPVPATQQNGYVSPSQNLNRGANTAFASASKDGWYARQRDEAKQAGSGPNSGLMAAPAERVASSRSVPMPQTATRPQPPEQARQVILEWSRPGPQGVGMQQPVPVNGTYLR